MQGNTPYDGRFVFVRLRYDSGFGGGFGRRGAPWSHDYPDGEVHFTKILDELTFLHVRTDGSNILSLDDPELFNYPIAYMAEPGFWAVSETEAANFRQYLLKGGFAIFDDFRGYDWNNLQDQMRRVLPEARWIQLDGKSPVFHSFFEIDHPETLAHPVDLRPEPDPEVLGAVREQRSDQAADGDRQREQRHQRVLGVFGHRPLRRRSVERGLQVRRELRDVWDDALSSCQLPAASFQLLELAAVAEVCGVMPNGYERRSRSTFGSLKRKLKAEAGSWKLAA